MVTTPPPLLGLPRFALRLLLTQTRLVGLHRLRGEGLLAAQQLRVHVLRIVVELDLAGELIQLCEHVLIEPGNARRFPQQAPGPARCRNRGDFTAVGLRVRDQLCGGTGVRLIVRLRLGGVLLLEARHVVDVTEAPGVLAESIGDLFFGP